MVPAKIPKMYMSVLVIEKKNILHNLTLIQQKAGGRIVYAVLKGDGYGLGLGMMADILKEQGITHFAVAWGRNAIRLREICPSAEILLLEPVYDREEALELLNNRITFTVTSRGGAEFLNKLCEEQGRQAFAHIEVDTGYGYYGFLPDRPDEIASVYKDCANIRIEGIYTHFYGCGRVESNRRQTAAFSRLLAALLERGIHPGIVHAANSTALFSCPDMLFDAVRVGSALVGRLATKEKYGLKRVGYIEAPIGEIRSLPKGHNIGYGGVYKTEAAVTIGVVRAGYAQGVTAEHPYEPVGMIRLIRKLLSTVKKFIQKNSPAVTVGGQAVPVLGRVGMNDLVINLSGIPCAVGDTVNIEINPTICADPAERQIRLD